MVWYWKIGTLLISFNSAATYNRIWFNDIFENAKASFIHRPYVSCFMLIAFFTNCVFYKHSFYLTIYVSWDLNLHYDKTFWLKYVIYVICNLCAKRRLQISWNSYTIFANRSLQYALSKFGLFFPDDYFQTSCIHLS